MVFNQIITLVRQLNSSGSLCQVSGVTYIGLSGNRGKYIDPGSSTKFYNRA